MPASSLELTLAAGPARFLLRAAESLPEESREAIRACLANLAEDFSAFQAESTALTSEQEQETVELELSSAGSPFRRGLGLPFKEGRFRGLGSRRVVRYFDGAKVIADRATRTVRVRARSSERLYEITYLFLLSRLGEAYERLGRHRVHGLGFRWPEEKGAWLLVMDSGVGKSRLALALRGRVEYYSDETPLLRGARLEPFPIRLAIAPSLLRRAGLEPEGRRKLTRLSYGTKSLVALPELGRLAEPAPVAVLAWVRRSSDGRARWREAKPLELGHALFRCLVVGVGVAQMAEHFLRLDLAGLRDLTRVAFSRWRAMRATLQGARERLTLDFSDDAQANAKMLDEIRAWLKS